ncbi:hypothetical protein, partial [uncultured Selenomonas sp.]|uniref:hypothetical protein n=1 Tax=uncultured Selenomonas sp. TaxID=159275 RepID=UPI0028D25814
KHAASVRPEPGSNSPKKLGLFALCFVAASRRVLSAHECASGASLRLAQKSLRFFSVSNIVMLDTENFAFSLQRAMIGSFYLWIRFFRTA